MFTNTLSKFYFVFLETIPNFMDYTFLGDRYSYSVQIQSQTPGFYSQVWNE